MTAPTDCVDAAAICARVKEIIAHVTSIAVSEIGDSVNLVDELDLDSLSMLEIAVDVDYEYRLGLPEATLQDARTVEDVVRLVCRELEARSAA